MINWKKNDKKRNDLTNFLKNMRQLDSFRDVDTIEYVQSLRGKSRIIEGKVYTRL